MSEGGIESDFGEPFQQTAFWGDFKAQWGWSKLQVELTSGEQVLILVRSFCRALFSIAYIPMYPKLSTQSDNCAVDLAHKLADVAKEVKNKLPKNCICLRFDPKVSFDTNQARNDFNNSVKLVSFADGLKVKKSSVDIQPPDTTLLNLDKSLDEILSAMKSKWRYNINLARRKGVIIEAVGASDKELDQKLDEFYKLYKETSERDGIALHELSYYKSLFQKSLEHGEVKVTLYLASFIEDGEGESFKGDGAKSKVIIEKDLDGKVITENATQNNKTFADKALKNKVLDDKAFEDKAFIDKVANAFKTADLKASAQEGGDIASDKSGEGCAALGKRVYLAGIITLFTKSEGVYLYGASGNAHRNLMPNFLLQYTALSDAKAFGSKVYDFYGIPPTADEHHPMHGLYMFKVGFGGPLIHVVGSWDVPLRLIYHFYTLAERLRAFYHKKVLKRIRGR